MRKLGTEIIILFSDCSYFSTLDFAVSTNQKVLKTIKEDNSTKLYTMKGSVFIFVQLINVIFGGHCPTGLLWHQQVGKCCQPITYCETGHQVKPCMTSGEQDYCESCPKGQTNSFNTSSFDMKACKPDTCSSDTTPDKNGKCVCNLLKGYTGNDSRYCLNNGKLCLKGTELQLDGDCKPCAFQYYKDWEGYGFCKKQLDCTVLSLEYKDHGNSKTAAICKKQQANYHYYDGHKQPNQINTFGFQPLLINITENPVLQSITEHALKSVHIKKDLFPKGNLSTRDLQIMLVILGVLLFISSGIIVYLIFIKKPTSKTVKRSPTLKTSISEFGWSNNRNHRPLPILPRQRTYSAPEADQYIPMNASRHPSCSKTNAHENIVAFRQQDIKDDCVYHGEDPYNISSPLNESTYVKIEPLSSNCQT